MLLACVQPGEFACNDDIPGMLTSGITVDLAAGQFCLIKVANDGTPDIGFLDFNFVFTPACPPDWNGVDGLDSQDFFDFLADFFNGNADFNGADGTDSQDYFDFLEAFILGC